MLVIKPKCYYLLITIQTFWFNIYTSYIYEDWISVGSTLLLYTSSTLYWINPRYGMIRNFDIVLVQCCYILGMFRSLYCTSSNILEYYYASNVVSILAFMIGYFVHHKSINMYILFHMLLHVSGTISATYNTICYNEKKLKTHYIIF